VLIKPRQLLQLKVFRSYRHVEKHAEGQIRKKSHCTSHWGESKTLSRTSPRIRGDRGRWSKNENNHAARGSDDKIHNATKTNHHD
jgi:hypothetical protein